MPIARWTPDEEKRLLDLIAAGKSWTLISAKLRRSMSTIRQRAKQLRLEKKKKRPEFELKAKRK